MISEEIEDSAEAQALISSDFVWNLPLVHHPESPVWQAVEGYEVIYDRTLSNGRAILFKSTDDPTMYVMRAIMMEFCFDREMNFDSLADVDLQLLDVSAKLYESYSNAAIKISDEQLAAMSKRVGWYGTH